MFHMKHASPANGPNQHVDESNAVMEAHVPADTARRLEIFAHQLSRWRRATNLVSDQSHSDLWRRHIQDSLQILNLAPDAKRWLDVGSGAGFPGLVIAIGLYGVPHAEVHCVESDKRKCAFLAQVVRETGISAVIHAARIEEIDPNTLIPVDAVTARALASLPELLKLSRIYLNQGAIGIFPQGRCPVNQTELPGWTNSYSIENVRSSTDSNSRIVRVRKEMGSPI